MAFRPGKGIGEGAAWAVGPATNAFSGADKAAAKTSLDSYTADASNAAWLAVYDARPALMVRLVWPAQTPTDEAFFARVNSTWVEVTPVLRGRRGIQGLQGNGVPPVSGDDNGAVLRVVAGAWAKVTGFPASIITSGTLAAGRIPTIGLTKLSDAVRARLLPTGANVGQVAKFTAEGWVAANESGGPGGGAATESTEAEAKAGSGDGSDRMSARRVATAIAAQVFQKHVIKFSAIDSNADVLDDGEIGFYQGSVQVSPHPSGSIGVTDTIYLAREQAAFGTDPSNPSVPLDSVDLAPFLDGLVLNGGSAFLAIQLYNSTEYAYVQAETVATREGGWTLTNLTWVNPPTVTGFGHSWNIVIGRSFPVLTKDIADLAKLVLRTDLEGHEDDKFYSYTNAFIGSGTDQRGLFCLFTGTEAPSDARAIVAGSIATGSGVVAFGRPRLDSDPDKLVWGASPVAADFPSGRVIHVSPWAPFDPNASLKITLTSAGTKVGTGNAAYVWAEATWEETGSIQVASDYFRASSQAPSALNVKLPWEAIINAPWIEDPASTVDENDLSAATPMLVKLAAGWVKTTIGALARWHSDHHTGLTAYSGYTRVAGVPASAGQVRWVSPEENSPGVLSIIPLNDANKALFKSRLSSGKIVRLEEADGDYLQGTTVNNLAEVVGVLSVNFTDERVEGTVSATGAGFKLEIENNIPARSEFTNARDYEGDDPDSLRLLTTDLEAVTNDRVQVIWEWNTLKNNTTTIPEGTIVSYNDRLYSVIQDIEPTATTVRGSDPEDVSIAAYFEPTHLNYVQQTYPGSTATYEFGVKNNSDRRETRLFFVWDVNNDKAQTGLLFDEDDGIAVLTATNAANGIDIETASSYTVHRFLEWDKTNDVLSLGAGAVVRSGTSLPSTARVGAQFTLTAADGSNSAGLYHSFTANTWTLVKAKP